jgi:hypothetical protein
VVKVSEDVGQVSRNGEVVQFPENIAVGNKGVEEGSSCPFRTK